MILQRLLVSGCNASCSVLHRCICVWDWTRLHHCWVGECWIHMSCQHFSGLSIVSQSARHCETWLSLDCCRAFEAALVAKGVQIEARMQSEPARRRFPQTPATKHCPHRHQIRRTPNQQIAVPASSPVFLYWLLCGDYHRILPTPVHPGPHSSA